MEISLVRSIIPFQYISFLDYLRGSYWKQLSTFILQWNDGIHTRTNDVCKIYAYFITFLPALQNLKDASAVEGPAPRNQLRMASWAASLVS
jgi:hypothetical protein